MLRTGLGQGLVFVGKLRHDFAALVPLLRDIATTKTLSHVLLRVAAPIVLAGSDKPAGR